MHTHYRQIQYGSNLIDYRLRYKNRKSMRINVYPDCSVEVIAPTATEDKEVEKKLRTRMRWVLKQQNFFRSFQPLTPPRLYISGETHLYLGHQYRLIIKDAEEPFIKLYRGILHARMPQPTAQKVQKLLDNWYREKAKIHFASVLKEVKPLFNRYNIIDPTLMVRSMKNRWGSCTAEGKIILNPELIKAPKGSIEYVVIHELCHLVHRHHDKHFYNLQSALMPDWQHWKMRLEQCLS